MSCSCVTDAEALAASAADPMMPCAPSADDSADNQSRSPYINRHNHDPRRTDYRVPPPVTGDAQLFGNPYYTLMRPLGKPNAVEFHEWARSGFRHGLVTYPAFIDAKSGNIIVSERDNHRLQIFDNVGGMSRFDRSASVGVDKNKVSSTRRPVPAENREL